MNIENSEKKIIADEFGKSGIVLDEIQIEQFYKYYVMLVEKNKVMNLTAITEFHDVIYKHFIDSCLIKDISEFKNLVDSTRYADERNVMLIDVGTGGGFPGIPIKILYPNIKMTLLDSLNKRINFLKEVVKELGLEGVECIHGRAEDYGSDIKYREKYDICVSRAVANLSTLSEYCVPFVKVGGSFISYKASDIQEEVSHSKKAVKILSSKIVGVKKIELNDNDENIYERNFVIITKERKLSKLYPRKSGIPSKNPL